MNHEKKILAGKAGLLFALCLGVQNGFAEEGPNVFLPPEGEPEVSTTDSNVDGQIITDPIVDEPVTGGIDPLPEPMVTTTGWPVDEVVESMPAPVEGEVPMADSVGRGGDDPLPYERTMTLSTETQDFSVMNKSEEAVTALPSITADAVSAVAALESETAVSPVSDVAATLDSTQVVGSAGDSATLGGPAIRNGRLTTP